MGAGRENAEGKHEKIIRRKLLGNLGRALCKHRTLRKGPIMTVDEKTFVQSCHELTAGDEIIAFHKGSLVHQGRVTERVPDHGLFWIMDQLTGGRRLLDMADLEIFRTLSPAIPGNTDTEQAAA